MNYRFLDDHREVRPVRLTCEVPVAEIESIHRGVKARYGSSRIHAEPLAGASPAASTRWPG